MLSMLKRLWRNESGQDLVGYVLLTALIALVLVAGIHTLGKSIAKSTAASANTLKAVAAGRRAAVAARRVTVATSRAGVARAVSAQ